MLKVEEFDGRMTHRPEGHILSWHLVKREAYIAELQTASTEPLTEAEIEREWKFFLDEVMAVQTHQENLLCALATSHGVKAVYLEGISKVLGSHGD